MPRLLSLLRLIRFSPERLREMSRPDSLDDAPLTGRSRGIYRRSVVEPELIRLDYRLGMPWEDGVLGMTLIWVHGDPRSSRVAAIGATTLSN